VTKPREIPDSGAAIRLGEKSRSPNETRWGMLLVLFMRIVAALWILQGLMQWQVVLGAPTSLFDTLPTATSIAVVYFAVMNLLAAVGLWLATPWGGVLWLLVAMSQIAVAIALPGFFDGGWFVIVLDVLLIGLYLLLTFEAGREPRRRGAPLRAMSRAWTSSSRIWDRLRSFKQ
jgi:hypothetical protein